MFVLITVMSVVALVARILYDRRFRDAPGNVTTAVAFAPPRSITPGLAAALLPKVEDARAVPAEVLDLAVTGAWKVGVRDDDGEAPDNRAAAGQVKKAKPGKQTWFVVRDSLTRPPLTGVAERVHLAVFPPGDTALRHDLTPDAERTARFAEAVGHAEREVVERGWVEERAGNAPARLAYLVGLGSGLVSLVAVLDVFRGNPQALWYLLPLAASVALMMLRPQDRRLTPEGRRLTDELDGLKLYMTMAEADRMRALQAPDTAQRLPSPDDRGAIAKLNERLLPYAVVFGIMPQWSQVVAQSYQAADMAPQWLYLPGYDPMLALGWMAFADAGGLGAFEGAVGDFEGGAGLDAGGLGAAGDPGAGGLDGGAGDGGGVDAGGFGGGDFGGGDFGGF